MQIKRGPTSSHFFEAKVKALPKSRIGYFLTSSRELLDSSTNSGSLINREVDIAEADYLERLL